MDLIYIRIGQYILEIFVFIILMFIFKFIFKKITVKTPRILNPREYFPDEEIHSLRQISLLIMMSLFFINILYAIVFWNSDIIYLSIFDILISLYLASTLDLSSMKNKILLILLIPYGSLTYIIFGKSIFGLVSLMHIPIYMYFIKVYYEKFREYTNSNGLGIAVLLLFSIIFFSFFITQVSEHVNPLDSLVMVSNSFTSNGYAVLGSSIPGKINSILLVWGGYVLSGVGTATLTAGILKNYYNNKFKEYDSRFDKLEELIKEIKEE